MLLRSTHVVAKEGKFPSFREYLQKEEGFAGKLFAQQKQITSKAEVNLSTRCSFDISSKLGV
jgi:hypothetical protein